MRSSVYVRFYPTAWVDHRVDPKLANTTPVEQNTRALCPGWPARSPTLHLSERSERAQGGVGGRSSRRKLSVCAVYVGKLCFLKAMISNF